MVKKYRFPSMHGNCGGKLLVEYGKIDKVWKIISRFPSMGGKNIWKHFLLCKK
jgi:hypothetical protein